MGPGAQSLVREVKGPDPVKLKALSFRIANEAQMCPFFSDCVTLSYVT